MYDYIGDIKKLLDNQALSWKNVYTFEEIIHNTFIGKMFILVYQEANEFTSLMLFTLNKRKHELIAKIEMITCKHFFHIVQLNKYMEEYFKELGVVEIEALAHPAIAGYMMKKHKYASPGLVIRKRLDGEN